MYKEVHKKLRCTKKFVRNPKDVHNELCKKFIKSFERRSLGVCKNDWKRGLWKAQQRFKEFARLISDMILGNS